LSERRSIVWHAEVVTHVSARGWRFVGVVVDGQPIDVGGLNLWGFEWVATGDQIEVPHPSYAGQLHRLDVWRVDTDRGVVTFAAGELSNGVWCFYRPERA
jgi:hypothetical protein